MTMFNEIHIDGHPFSTDTEVGIVFLKSLNVQAFPCGRRRSDEITDADGATYHIPYDPEARLNTEANNTKHSGLNGFTQSFVKSTWTEDGIDTLSLILGGYLFNIKLDTGYKTANAFGSAIISKLKSIPGLNSDPELAELANSINAATKIYANIIVEDIPLYSGFTTYKTSVLRNQSAGETILSYIDLKNAEGTTNSELFKNNPKDYFYFAGLSFSTVPLSDREDSQPNITTNEEGEIDKRYISMRILDFVNNEWVAHQESYLPNIKHGSSKDSVEVNTIITTGDIKRKIVTGLEEEFLDVPSLKLVSQGDGETYRMTFSAVTKE